MIAQLIVRRLRIPILAITFCISIFSGALQAQQHDQLRIGFIVPLSGALAEFGYAIQNGVILAGEDNPAVNTIVRALYEDSRYDSKTSVANFQKLHSVDRVHAVYVFGGPMSDTLAPITERARTPMFSTEYDVRYTRDRKYVIRFANNAADYAAVLLAQLRARKLGRFGIVKVETQYHNTLHHALLTQLAQSESAQLLYNFQPGESDFRAAAAKLGRENFDALGVYLTPGMQHSFFSQLKPLGLRLQLFGTDSFESRAENAGVEETVEGALYANSHVADDFIRRYRARFGNNAQIVHAALAYEFTLLVADLFHNIPDTAAEFMQRFQLSAGRPSVCGEYYYRNSPETGQYFSFPIAVREVRNGQARVISVTPAS